MSANYFASASAAERYRRARPNVHPAVMAQVAPRIGRVGRALDVGCGTGMSSRALLDLARSVIGVDLSVEMLHWAGSHARVCFAASAAESLPFRSGTFDLISVGMAFHWFDRTRFLEEARRVLRANGWLLIYNTWFTGQMLENVSFAGWFQKHYLTRYPTPPRHAETVSKVEAEAAGFARVESTGVEQKVSFSRAALVDYLTTQSNIVAAAEHGRESLADVIAWLQRSLQPLFRAEEASFLFDGSVWLLRKQSNV